MKKFAIILVLIALIASMAPMVHAAPPPDGPPGLERAIEVKEAHTEALMAIPGVVGVAVGLGADGGHVLKVYTKSARVSGLPRQLDGVLVSVEVTGEIVALAKGNPGGKGGGRNKGPVADSQVIMKQSGPTSFNITLEGSNRSCSGLEFSFTCNTSATDNGTLAPLSGPMNCTDGKLTANVTYTTTSNDFFDSFTFMISDGDNESNEAKVTIVVGSPSRATPAYTGTSSGTERLYKSKGSWWCTVGTLGARLTDNSGNVYALSNNHVYALEGEGEIGDWILQPGRADMIGCGTPTEINEAIIGYLSAYIPIQFKGNASNKVDAAVAWTTIGMVGQSTNSTPVYTPSSTTTNATLEMGVKKYGRTTGLTHGYVDAVEATIKVRFDSGIATFDDQIVFVSSNETDFSTGGDSGSLIVTDDEGNSPVALLFAGSGAYTFGNPIQAVLDALETELEVATLRIDGPPQ